MGLFRKKVERRSYDHEKQIPVIRVSICTGEKTACFQNIETGKREEVMLIRNERDLEEFREMYGIQEEIKTVY